MQSCPSQMTAVLLYDSDVEESWGFSVREDGMKSIIDVQKHRDGGNKSISLFVIF